MYVGYYRVFEIDELLHDQDVRQCMSTCDAYPMHSIINLAHVMYFFT